MGLLGYFFGVLAVMAGILVVLGLFAGVVVPWAYRYVDDWPVVKCVAISGGSLVGLAAALAVIGWLMGGATR